MKQRNMWRRWGLPAALLVCGVIAFGPGPAQAERKTRGLSVTGQVSNPLHLSPADLAQFQSVQVQLNEIRTDGSFAGVFFYRGVPLRNLLRTAHVNKADAEFKKPVDLAVRVRNAAGKTVALSWGEVFLRNPGDVVVAISATPVRPHHACTKCHSPEESGPRMAQLDRTIAFPKLVVSSDQWSNRSIEGITAIEVVDLRPEQPTKKPDRLFSPQVSISGRDGSSVVLKGLESDSRISVRLPQVGEGKGFHGIPEFQGAPLREVLERAGIQADPADVFLVSAPDGYRSLLSYGELFLSRHAGRTLLADREDGAPIEQNGRFFMVVPDDRMADRWVKAVEKIQVLSLRLQPAIEVVGMGCGDTPLITLEAVSALARADDLVCPPDLRRQFSAYLGDKPVLFNLYDFAPPVLKKKYPDQSQAERDRFMEAQQRAGMEKIRASLGQGRRVAVLEYGDPTIWSGWRWIWEEAGDLPVNIIPGLSSFNAGNALLGEDIACEGSVILTTPWDLRDNRDMLPSVAQNGDTLCIFMGLGRIPQWAPVLESVMPAETPAAIVYRAGYSSGETVIHTTLADLPKAADAQPEKFLGLIYVGPCVTAQRVAECQP